MSCKDNEAEMAPLGEKSRSVKLESQPSKGLPDSFVYPDENDDISENSVKKNRSMSVKHDPKVVKADNNDQSLSVKPIAVKAKTNPNIQQPDYKEVENKANLSDQKAIDKVPKQEKNEEPIEIKDENPKLSINDDSRKENMSKSQSNQQNSKDEEVIDKKVTETSKLVDDNDENNNVRSSEDLKEQVKKSDKKETQIEPKTDPKIIKSGSTDIIGKDDNLSNKSLQNNENKTQGLTNANNKIPSEPNTEEVDKKQFKEEKQTINEDENKNDPNNIEIDKNIEDSPSVQDPQVKNNEGHNDGPKSPKENESDKTRNDNNKTGPFAVGKKAPPSKFKTQAFQETNKQLNNQIDPKIFEELKRKELELQKKEQTLNEEVIKQRKISQQLNLDLKEVEKVKKELLSKEQKLDELNKIALLKIEKQKESAKQLEIEKQKELKEIKIKKDEEVRLLKELEDQKIKQENTIKEENEKIKQLQKKNEEKEEEINKLKADNQRNSKLSNKPEKNEEDQSFDSSQGDKNLAHKSVLDTTNKENLNESFKRHEDGLPENNEAIEQPFQEKEIINHQIKDDYLDIDHLRSQDKDEGGLTPIKEESINGTPRIQGSFAEVNKNSKEDDKLPNKDIQMHEIPSQLDIEREEIKDAEKVIDQISKKYLEEINNDDTPKYEQRSRSLEKNKINLNDTSQDKKKRQIGNFIDKQKRSKIKKPPNSERGWNKKDFGQLVNVNPILRKENHQQKKKATSPQISDKVIMEHVGMVPSHNESFVKNNHSSSKVNQSRTSSKNNQSRFKDKPSPYSLQNSNKLLRNAFKVELVISPQEFSKIKPSKFKIKKINLPDKQRSNGSIIKKYKLSKTKSSIHTSGYHKFNKNDQISQNKRSPSRSPNQSNKKFQRDIYSISFNKNKFNKQKKHHYYDPNDYKKPFNRKFKSDLGMIGENRTPKFSNFKITLGPTKLPAVESRKNKNHFTSKHSLIFRGLRNC